MVWGGSFPVEASVTFKQIIDDAAERLGNLQPEARVRFRRYINEWYRRILSEVTLPRGATRTLAIVAGTEEYALHASVGRVRAIYDPTNGRKLIERPLEWMRDQDPEETTSGVPEFYAYVTDRTIRLYPSPSANNTVNIDYDAVVTEMDDDADVPVIPEDFHYLLGIGIRVNEYEKNSDSRLRDAREEMVAGIAALRYWIAGRKGHVLNPGYRGSAGTSRLGSWYPRGT